MEPDVILRRIHELELEVAKLKTQLSRGGSRRVQVVVKKSVGFVLTYWTLLSFVVAIGVAFYIKKAFNVDYFENYRTLAASREIAEFHNRLGNNLLQRQEWGAAEDAFGRALAANSNHPDAAYGQLKSRIFKPASGEKISSPRTQDIMISFLREQRPEDPDLDMLQALRYWGQDQAAEAKAAALAALKKKPDFSWALMMLGHIEMAAGNLAEAIQWNEKAVAADPDDATARGNLGFMFLITGKFDEAITQLDRAFAGDASLLMPVVLSDAYRLKGAYAQSLVYSRASTNLVAKEDVRTSRMIGGEWYYNYLPLSKDDTNSVKDGIYAITNESKEALCHFAFALDSALAGNPADAEKSWARVWELSPGVGLRDYCLNKIAATLAWAPTPPPDSAVQWLEAKVEELKAK